MGASNLVIKLKYGDMFRRLTVLITDNELDLNIDELRDKICSLFNLAPSSELRLSYIDEDGDEVTLVDDDDLCDVLNQDLNPLRITVKLAIPNNVGKHDHLNGSSSTFSRVTSESPNEIIIKLLAGLALSYAPCLSEIINGFTKMGKSCLACAATETTSQFDVSEKTKSLKLSEGDGATLKIQSNGEVEEQALKPMESLETLEPCATSVNTERVESAPEVIMKASSLTSPLFNVVSLDSEPENVDEAVIVSSQNLATASARLTPVLSSADKIEKTKKEKVSELGQCDSNERSFMTSSDGAKHVCTEKGDDKLNQDLGLNTPDIKCLETTGVDNIQGRIESLLSIWAPKSSSLKLPDYCSNPSRPRYECTLTSFPQIPLENVPTSPSPPSSKVFTHSGRRSQNIDSFGIFHCGIQCDGCGVHPITGPRFKSKVKVNYDLCMICIADIGNARDYIRMDCPVVYPHHLMHASHSKKGISASRQDFLDFEVKSHLPKLDNCFVKDVNIVEGTVFAPLTPFTKIWRMKNTGTVMWPQTTQLLWIGGDSWDHAFSADLKIHATGVDIGQELDVTVDCIAPEAPGYYASFWQMATPSGQKFGQVIGVLIQVDASAEAEPCESVIEFNLNLVPAEESLFDLEMMNVIPKPIAEDHHTNPAPSKPNKLNMNIPVDSSFLVSDWASRYVPPPVSSPTIYFPTVASPISSENDLPLFTQEFVANRVASATTKKLGMPPVIADKFVNLNRWDDMKPDVPHGVSPWDNILDSLDLMDFHDREANQKLLEMNDASNKRTIPELYAAHKREEIHLNESHKTCFRFEF